MTDLSVRLSIEVRPGSSEESIRWDPWRGVWVVHVTARPQRGEANGAVRAALARWLGVDPATVGVVRGASARAKLVQVDGLSGDEATRRLRHAAEDH